MQFYDRAQIVDAARITRDGYLVAEARVARADNVQDYAPEELGLPPKPDGSLYRIGRPAAEVFATDAMASLAHRPVTVGHPKGDVQAGNWRSLAVGDIGADVIRDGEFVRVPLKVMDAAAVEKARTTHQEFSPGYTADLDMTPTTIGDQAVDGVMRNLRYNHLALVPRARGGAALRIIDERPEHLRDQETTMKIKIGDAEVDLSDGAAVAVAIGQINAKLADAETRVGALSAEAATLRQTVEARDGEIAALQQQVADAAVTPERLQQMVQERAQLIADAKAVAGDKLVVDGKTDAEIRKAAVALRIGDAKADALSDEGIKGAFAALIDAGQANAPAPRGVPKSIGDAAANERDALAKANDFNSWRHA